ncbi:MAG: translation initiation factor [Candidatus Aenigmarchaeota archaeon]|nr:translation initiation factor [Candidatus Aenigmarchaeota archaeon]
MVCSKCGLPPELCVCETIAKEKQKIFISVVKKRFGKLMTIVSGIDSNDINIKDLLKKFKSKLACGGTFKNNVIELQGNHKIRVKAILIGEGFPESMIEMS